jgi:hypothetical protein
LILAKMGWATFWATFSKIHLATLNRAFGLGNGLYGLVLRQMGHQTLACGFNWENVHIV